MALERTMVLVDQYFGRFRSQARGTFFQLNVGTLQLELDYLMHEYCLLCPIDTLSLIVKFWSKMVKRQQFSFSIYLTYGNHSTAHSQT